MSMEQKCPGKEPGEGEAVLLSSKAVVAHALPRLCELAENILPCEVTGAEKAGSHRKTSPISPEPIPGGRYHDWSEVPVKSKLILLYAV